MGIILDVAYAVAIVVGQLVALVRYAESSAERAHNLNREDLESNR
jgi:hypothetical protein